MQRSASFHLGDPCRTAKFAHFNEPIFRIVYPIVGLGDPLGLGDKDRLAGDLRLWATFTHCQKISHRFQFVSTPLNELSISP
jgi:hypothetical protein